MDVSVVFYEVLILFIIMAAGFVAAKTNVLGEKSRGQISSFVINITLPIVILMSSQMDFSQDKITNSLWLLFMAVVVFLISIVIAGIIFNKTDVDKRKVLKFASVFSNSAYMGFPILYALMGNEGVFYGAVFIIPFNIFVWTYGLLLFKKHDNLKQTFKNILTPSIIAMMAAFIFLGFGVKIPYPLDKGLNIIGGLTTPLSMIVIGETLAAAKLKNILSDGWIYMVSSVRLLLLPAIAYLLFFWLSPPEMALRILVLLVGMPCAAATTIFAQQFGGDTKLASGIVFMSTIFSIGTIPLIILLFL